MDKSLRKCYEYLDLSFSASVEDVELRKNALVKIFGNKAREKGVSYDKQIGLVESSAAAIIENLKNNGTPMVKNHYFNSSWKSISLLSITLAFLVLLCAFSFYIFL